jgi:hypothetical protein
LAFFRLTVARCLSWPCSKDSASCLEFCDLRHCIVGLDASVDSGAIWTWTDFIRRADFRGTRKVHARRRNRRDHDRLQDVSPGPRSDTIPGATCKLARRFVALATETLPRSYCGLACEELPCVEVGEPTHLSGVTVAMTFTVVRRRLSTSQPTSAALEAPARSKRLSPLLLLMRFDGLAMGARRGVDPFIWALGLLLIFVCSLDLLA